MEAFFITIYAFGIIGFWAVSEGPRRLRLGLGMAWLVVVPVIGALWVVYEGWNWLRR